MESSEHNLKHPCASSASAAPWTTAIPARRRGCQQLCSRFGAALPPARWHDDPDNGFPAGVQSHILQRDARVPGSVCIDNKPAATDPWGSKLASGRKTPQW